MSGQLSAISSQRPIKRKAFDSLFGAAMDVTEAEAYRTAWDLAIRHKARKALRAELRFLMRCYALSAVRKVHEQRVRLAQLAPLNPQPGR